MPGSTAPYCTISDLQNELGAAYVAAMVDDSPPSPTDRDAIDEASRDIDSYLYLIYGANLTTSDTVKKICRRRAAWFLCQDRGNPCPPGLANKVQRDEKLLVRLQKGQAQLSDCAPIKAAIPVLSNVRVRLDPFPRPVVERNNSTGNPQGYTVNDDKTETGISYGGL